MGKLTESAPDILEQAAKSPLGIFALMILALAVLGFFYFRKSSERTRTAIFVMMFVGVAFFGWATVRTASQSQVASSGGGMPPTQAASAQPTDSNHQASVSTASPPPVESKAEASPPPVGSKAAASPASFSTDRDHPTRLISNEVRGTGLDRKRTRYYFSFLGGPGEVKVTFDYTSGGVNQLVQVELFDEDFSKMGYYMILGGNRGDTRREVKRVPLTQQQTVIAEIDIDAEHSAPAGSFLLRVEGAVRFQ